MKNRTGEKHGMITIVDFSHRKNNLYYWNCVCECGNKKIIQYGNLQSGSVKSCGCSSAKMRTTHGLRHTSLYNIYQAMIARCYNQSYPDFQNWGGRGITVCKEWKDSRTIFFEWALINGYKKGLQIDRKNNTLGYSPSNCRFVTRKVNCRNKRSNVIIAYHGESKTLVEWCDILNIPYRLTRQRIRNLNWKPEQAFNTPLFQRVKSLQK